MKTQEDLASFVRTDLVAHVTSLLEKDTRLHEGRYPLYVEDVVILLGNPNADLCAIVRAKSHAAILKFVTSGLRTMLSISSTSTYQEAWSSKEADPPRELEEEAN